MKNMVPAGNYGSTYGQDVEPSGTYVSEKTYEGPIPNDGRAKYVEGIANIMKPYYINLDDYGNPIDYKYDLSKKYKAKGKKLTDKMMRDGYDAIVTYDEIKGKKYTSEIVLFPNCNFNLNIKENLSLFNIFKKINEN